MGRLSRSKDRYQEGTEYGKDPGRDKCGVP